MKCKFLSVCFVFTNLNNMDIDVFVCVQCYAEKRRENISSREKHKTTSNCSTVSEQIK